MDSKLKKLSEVLKKNRKDRINYTVPNLWFLENYSIEHRMLPDQEVMVNPYDFYNAVIEEYLLPKMKDNIDYGVSYSKANNLKSTNGDWIRKEVL